MKKLSIFLFMSITLMSCGHFVSDQLSDNTIAVFIHDGDYKNAKALIKLKIATEGISDSEVVVLNRQLAVLDRIEIDFNKSDSVTQLMIKEQYPDATLKVVEGWERDKVLECLTINGEKRYFRNAVRNIQRILDPKSDDLDIFLADYIAESVNDAKGKKSILCNPEDFKIRYTLTIDPDAVPSGEIVRVWMPYIRNNQQYKNIKLIATSQNDYIISPDTYSHKSIYMEKVAEKGKPTSFWYELSYTAYNEFFDFDPQDIKPYDKESELYKEYTAERTTHVVFTDRIKHITDSLINGIDNPYLKSVKIFDWIADNYPWASAREYSTIENIPEYVLDNGHGDCGQVTLLFITMARYAGIPTRWESGWMLHPRNINLHDWAETYYEGIGWVGVDQSFGRVLNEQDLNNDIPRGRVIKDGMASKKDLDVYYFFTRGMDAYRFIVNSDYSMPFFPAKIYTRSETVDFQRGEVEWRGGNLYFNKWNYDMEVL